MTNTSEYLLNRKNNYQKYVSTRYDAYPDIQYSSLGYGEECLGLHYGRIHQADLGDIFSTY